MTATLAATETATRLPLLADVPAILRHPGLTHGQQAARWRMADAIRAIRDHLDDHPALDDDEFAGAVRELLNAMADADDADNRAAREQGR